jgi:hypothetical protein
MQTASSCVRLRSRGLAVASFTEAHNRRRMSSVAVQALDQLCAGVIIADNDGRVVEMNRAAEATVQLGDGLNICNGRLCARRAFETIKIAKLIAGATAGSKSGAAAGRMLVGRCDGLPPYVLTVAPLRTDMAVDNRGACNDRRCRPATPLPFGGGPRGILWVVAGRGAACGGAADRKDTGSDRRRRRRSDHDAANPARFDPEKSRRRTAVRSDPDIVEHRDRYSVLLGRVVQYGRSRYANAPVVSRGLNQNSVALPPGPCLFITLNQPPSIPSRAALAKCASEKTKLCDRIVPFNWIYFY